EQVASTGFFTALGLGAVLALLGTLFVDPLVRVLGATDTIMPFARDYVRYILWGAPIFCASLVMNNQLRMQGSAFFAMLGMCSGGLINIVLDPLFIFTLNMGTGGAALATVISQCFSFAILLRNCFVGGNIRIRLRNFTPKWDVFRNILAGGLPSLYRQGLNSVATICLNLSAGPYGDAAIAAMSVVTRIFMFS
ncbi:MAG TPA: MATE family efflux transporter, partial [Clostridia bacterium]|nr:MATE family efflux transporter [Clostridia bacterium]